MAKMWWTMITVSCLALSSVTVGFASVTQIDIVVLLANSENIQKSDPNALIKQTIDKVLPQLPSDTRIAIITYGERILLMAPFTPLDPNNMSTLRDRLNSITPQGKFTNSAAGMERAIYELKNNARPDTEKAIIFLTDSSITTGNDSRDEEFSKWLREILAAEAASAGIQVHSIAFTENADIQSAQILAHKTGGNYYRAFNLEDIEPALRIVLAAVTGTQVLAQSPHTESQTEAPPITVAKTLPKETESKDTTITLSESQQQTLAPTPLPPRVSDTTTSMEPSIAQSVAPEASSLSQRAQASQTEPKKPAVPFLENITLVVILGVIGGFGILTIILFIYVVLQKRKSQSVKRPQLAAGADTSLGLLEDISGKTNRQHHDISGKLTWISRAPGEESANVRTIVINDERVSRDHALIQFKNSGYWLTDRGSVNGTYVNGERLTGDRLLKHGDTIRFGQNEFKFTIPQKKELAKKDIPSWSAEESPTVITNPHAQRVASTVVAPAAEQTPYGAEEFMDKPMFPDAGANMEPGITTTVPKDLPDDRKAQSSELQGDLTHQAKSASYANVERHPQELGKETRADSTVVKEETSVIQQNRPEQTQEGTEEIKLEFDRDSEKPKKQPEGDTEELSLDDIRNTLFTDSSAQIDESTIVTPLKSNKAKIAENLRKSDRRHEENDDDDEKTLA